MGIIRLLIKIRKLQGITQCAVASHLDITPVTLNRYEKGKREMPSIIMEKYADYLGYDVKLMVSE